MKPITPSYRVTRRFGNWTRPDDGRLFPFTALHEERIGYRQAKPYDVDTAYTYTFGVSQKTPKNTAIPPNADAVRNTAKLDRAREDATNQARAKFVGKIGDASQLGSTATAEAKATYRTIVGGIATALKAARHVARLEFGKAGNLLGFRAPVVIRKKIIKVKRGKRVVRKTIGRPYWEFPDGRTVAKTAGNRWLWYSYGVKPVIEDLFNASEVFTREQPQTRVQGRGQSAVTERLSYGPEENRKIQVNCIVSAFVRVKNPNLWLANQLGLLNPIQWFNEGVAFSFVIDWFSNWSQWLQQLTDFVGLEIARPSTFVLTRTMTENTVAGWKHEWNQSTRHLTMPSVKLRFQYERFQWQRGANAISLLVQFLGDKKK